MMPIPVERSKFKSDHRDALRRKFFALCNEWDINASEMKEYVKRIAKVESFNDLSEEQLELIITKMEEKGGDNSE